MNSQMNRQMMNSRPMMSGSPCHQMGGSPMNCGPPMGSPMGGPCGSSPHRNPMVCGPPMMSCGAPGNSPHALSMNRSPSAMGSPHMVPNMRGNSPMECAAMVKPSLNCASPMGSPIPQNTNMNIHPPMSSPMTMGPSPLNGHPNSGPGGSPMMMGRGGPSPLTNSPMSMNMPVSSADMSDMNNPHMSVDNNGCPVRGPPCPGSNNMACRQPMSNQQCNSMPGPSNMMNCPRGMPCPQMMRGPPQPSEQHRLMTPMMHHSQMPNSQQPGGYGPGPNSKPMPVSAGKVKKSFVVLFLQIIIYIILISNSYLYYLFSSHYTYYACYIHSLFYLPIYCQHYNPYIIVGFFITFYKIYLLA